MFLEGCLQAMNNQNSKMVNRFFQIMLFLLLTNSVFIAYAADMICEKHPQTQTERHKMGTNFRLITK